MPRFAWRVYILESLIFLAIFLSPKGLMESLSLGWFGSISCPAGTDIWPNIFLTVGEAGSITLKKTYFSYRELCDIWIAVAGFFWEGLHVLRRQDARERFGSFSSFLWSAHITHVFKRKGFLLFVLPLAIFTGFGAGKIHRMGSRIPSEVSSGCEAEGWQSTAFLLMGNMLCTHAFIFRGYRCDGIKPIMDDVWYAGLLECVPKRQDAIVDSWCRLGISSRSPHGRVVVENCDCSYFLLECQVLMAEDERRRGSADAQQSGNAPIFSKVWDWKFLSG